MIDLTDCCPSVLQHCLLGHLTQEPSMDDWIKHGTDMKVVGARQMGWDIIISGFGIYGAAAVFAISGIASQNAPQN